MQEKLNVFNKCGNQGIENEARIILISYVRMSFFVWYCCFWIIRLWFNDDDFTCSNQFWNTLLYLLCECLCFQMLLCHAMPYHAIYKIYIAFDEWPIFPLKHTTVSSVRHGGRKANDTHKHSNLNFNDDDSTYWKCMLCPCVYVFNVAIQSVMHLVNAHQIEIRTNDSDFFKVFTHHIM